jgi:hypothetical protein
VDTDGGVTGTARGSELCTAVFPLVIPILDPQERFKSASLRDEDWDTHTSLREHVPAAAFDKYQCACCWKTPQSRLHGT